MTIGLQRALVLGVIVLFVAPPSPTINSGRSDESWPLLLSREPPSDPIVAHLHERANVVLESLVRSEMWSHRPLQLVETRNDDSAIITEH
jgi:hypothetical protein